MFELRASAIVIAASLMTLGFGLRASEAELYPVEAYTSIRDTRLDPAQAVSLRGVELELGLARFNLEQGVLIPVVTADGSVTEMVFIGRARFRVSPPNEIEAGQLELFTGRRAVDTSVEEAVFVITRQETVRALLDRPPVTDLRPAMLETAKSIHRDWLAKTERRNMGVEAALFLHRIGDPLYERFVGVWMKSYELGEFVYQHDPADAEQITLASFEPIGVRGWERRRLQRHLRVQQRKGRWLGTRIEDLGAWDVWLSAPWNSDGTSSGAGDGNSAAEGNVGFESRHYEIDVKVRRDLKLTGSATLQLEAQASGRRAVRLELFRDLVVQRVLDSNAQSLFFLRLGHEVLVHLPQPVAAGELVELRVEYEGYAFDDPVGGAIDLKDTVNWHPHCGSTDRATYDVRISLPKRWQLVAGGAPAGTGVERGFRWERRKVDRPAIAFSFVVGRFVEEQMEVNGVTLRVAFSKGSFVQHKGPATRRVIESLGSALQFYEDQLGEYPLDSLQVAVLPRKYSQSFLGYITLADSIFIQDAARRGEEFDVVRDLTIAHETAHQWWGNLIGWSSYRDQWLSESMANYAALYYLSRRGETGSDFLAEMSAGWRNSLGQRTPDGRIIESLGPIVLGERLNSSVASNGYRPIVYRKGAVVLSMLSRAVGPERFMHMLGELADAAADHVLTTETFLAAIERMSGMELDGFARQFIYGTGIPQVYYDYEVAQNGDGWRIVGQAKVLDEPRFAFSIVPDHENWQVRRERVDPDAQLEIAMMVPFRVRSTEASGVGRVHLGQILFDEADNAFSLEMPDPVDQFSLDPQSEVFARFYSREDSPKRVARFRGMDLMTEGDLVEAEVNLSRALDFEFSPEVDVAGGSIPWLRSDRAADRTENVRIHLLLARLYVDRGNEVEAWAQLNAIDELLEDAPEFSRMQRDSLSARLELTAGDVEAAFRRLRKTLRMASPKHGSQAWRPLLTQLRLNAEREAMTEAFSLLTVAALRLGRDEDYRWALDEARDRGVDVRALPRIDSEGSSPILSR